MMHMRTSNTSLISLLAALLSIPSAPAASPDGFALWKPAQLRAREQALSRSVRPDHSSRETLADYKDHRFRMLYRDADGVPEQHDNEIDVVIVQSGEGTLLLGGKMTAPQTNSEGSGAGEWKGTGIEGGEKHALGPGDVVHIPAKLPHSFLVPKGKHITYVLLKIPAR
jgi:mannose-6-phosphate isomerase-like protein (cupin superfamily)